MPRILEMKDIDGDLWVRVGKFGEFESGVALFTPAEQKREIEQNYHRGFNDAINGDERTP